MDSWLLEYGVELVHDLDAAFGLPPKTVMSQRDVPGLTRAAVPYLHGAGVQALTVGVNGGSAPPGVPHNRPFWWRDEHSGTQLLAFWHAGACWDDTQVETCFNVLIRSHTCVRVCCLCAVVATEQAVQQQNLWTAHNDTTVIYTSITPLLPLLQSHHCYFHHTTTNSTFITPLPPSRQSPDYQLHFHHTTTNSTFMTHLLSVSTPHPQGGTVPGGPQSPWWSPASGTCSTRPGGATTQGHPVLMRLLGFLHALEQCFPTPRCAK